MIYSNGRGTKIFRRRLSLPNLDQLLCLSGELDHLSADTDSNNRSTPKHTCNVVEADENEGPETVERAEITAYSPFNSSKDSDHIKN